MIEYIETVFPAYFYHWSDLVGLVGTVLLMTGFFLVQTRKLDTKDIRYSLINMGVAIFLGINLIFKPIPANIILECFWLVMSVYGIRMWYKEKYELR